jgi:hypothetical protein
MSEQDPPIAALAMRTAPASSSQPATQALTEVERADVVFHIAELFQIFD